MNSFLSLFQFVSRRLFFNTGCTAKFFKILSVCCMCGMCHSIPRHLGDVTIFYRYT